MSGSSIKRLSLYIARGARHYLKQKKRRSLSLPIAKSTAQHNESSIRQYALTTAACSCCAISATARYMTCIESQIQYKPKIWVISHLDLDAASTFYRMSRAFGFTAGRGGRYILCTYADCIYTSYEWTVNWLSSYAWPPRKSNLILASLCAWYNEIFFLFAS